MGFLSKLAKSGAAKKAMDEARKPQNQRKPRIWPRSPARVASHPADPRCLGICLRTASVSEREQFARLVVEAREFSACDNGPALRCRHPRLTKSRTKRRSRKPAPDLCYQWAILGLKE